MVSFSRGQSEYIAAVIAVISMTLLSMLYINIVEGINKETSLSIKRIASLREELEVVYTRDSHILSIEGEGKPLYIVYVTGDKLYIDRINTSDRHIDLTTFPKYSELIEGSRTIGRICIITYSQNMFCEKSNTKTHNANSSLLLAALVSKCTVMLSRYLNDQDLFQLFKGYYTYNCSTTSYPISSISVTTTFSFSNNGIEYMVKSSDGFLWGFGSIPYELLPIDSYILLGYRNFTYSLGVANLIVDIYVYYSFPEMGIAIDVDGRSIAYVWPVPKVEVVQRLTHRDYLLAVSTRTSCTSLPCYLLYAIRDYVDYPWQSYSGDFGWWLRFRPASIVDRSVGIDDGYIGRYTVYADYRVLATGINITVNSVNNLYCYNRIDQLYRELTPLSIAIATANLDTYGRWLPRDFLTPTSLSSYKTYVKRAMSVYNTSTASFYIYSYIYDGRRYQVYLDYTNPATHVITITFRYGVDRPLYLFLLSR